MDNIIRIIKESIGGKELIKYNLKFDPFYNTIQSPIEDNVNRDNSIRELSISLTNLANKRSSHIAILGCHGIGKTHLMKLFYLSLEKNKEVLEELGFDKIIYIDGITEFKRLVVERDKIQEDDITTLIEPVLLNEKKRFPERKIILFIDDLDVAIERYPIQTITLFETFRNSIIGTWNSELWSGKQKYKLPKPDVIYLEQFEKEDAFKLLKKRIKKASIDKKNKIFSEDILKEFPLHFGGNPSRLLTFAKKFLRYLLNNGLNPDNKSFVDFLNNMNIQSFEELKDKVLKLRKREKEIFKAVLNTTEITARELGIIFNFSRVAAFKYLNIFEEMGIVESKRKGRRIVYYVPNQLIQWLQDEEEFNKN